MRTLRKMSVQTGAISGSAIKWVVLPLVLLMAAVGAHTYFNYASERESTDDAQIDGHIYPVSSRIDGTLLEVLAENNQVVQPGTILARIDPSYYDATLAKARGELAAASATEMESRQHIRVAQTGTTAELSGAEATIAAQNAKIATAQREVEAATERLATARVRVREAEANAQRAAADLNRMKPLAAKQEISRLQFDAYSATEASNAAALDAAKSHVREAEQAIRVAETKRDEERAHLPEIRARVEGARTGPQQVAALQAGAASSAGKVLEKQAELRQAELNLDYTILRAPVGGMVSQRSMEKGQTVNRGQPLVSIVPLDDVWVTANFKESQLAKMRPGQPVTVSVDAYGREYKGHVDSIAAATGARFSLLPPENATGNYVKVVQRIPVKIVLEKGQNQDHLLRPGMSVMPVVLTK